MPDLPPLRPEDITAELEPHHRDAMLDLVLVWGSLDGAFGVLLSHVLGVSAPEGAELLQGMPSWKRLEEVHKLLRSAPGGKQAASTIRKYKKVYGRYSVIRNRVAHSHCAGYWSLEPDYIVFDVYERVGDDNLAFEAVPIQKFNRATRWGREMLALTCRLIDGDSKGPNEQSLVVADIEDD